MRATFTIILTVFFLKVTFAQSPFNYGQNKKVYFISTELRNKLSIDSIYTVDFDADESGGMGENWDVTVISFYEDYVTDYWYPISKDSTYVYNFDSLIANMQFLNGSRYLFSNRTLTSYGGEGYGTFDWKEIFQFSDTVSIAEASCTGHCGGNANIHYCKNVFNKKGQLIYNVYYPTSNQEETINEEEYTEEVAEDDVIFEEAGIYEEENMNEEPTSSQADEKELTAYITAENIPDTLHYRYNKKGLLLNTNRENSITKIKDVKFLFTNPGSFAGSDFHQCYISTIEMEKYIVEKLGYTPELILIEMYKQAVFSFTLNAADKKYYQTNFVILEQ